MKAKKEIRQQIREKMNHFSKEYEMQSERLCYKQVVALSKWKQADCILIYVSFQHEMGTELLIEEAFRTGKQVASPRVEGKEMNFYSYSSKEELIRSAYGILEPVPNDIPIPENALMIMPGVAFDLNKNRIGYGGGYYDKYIEKHPNHYKIAIAYEAQLVDCIETKAHDMKPDLIVTEKRMI